MTNINIPLTALEAEALGLVRVGRISFFDDGFKADSSCWTDTFCEDISDLMGIGLQSAGGVLSSMIQKGIFTKGDESVFLTEAGVAAGNDLAAAGF